MAVAESEWLRLIESEYVSGFIASGGAAVKFVIGHGERLASVRQGLADLAQRHKLQYVSIDAAATKLHMIQDVFFAISRALDWDAMAQRFIEALFNKQGYEWPSPGHAIAIHRIAERNGVDVTLLRRDLRQWLTSEVMRDTEMAQDFRVAMTQLCLRRVEPEETKPGITMPIIDWLHGTLRQIGTLRDAPIVAKITRHNGQAMLRSLCRWLRLSGQRGLLLILDIRQLGKSGSAAGEGLRYSSAAVMDAFEVLRQLIDDAEHFAGLLVVLLADELLMVEIGSKRSIYAYVALMMRVVNDVRPEGRDNPLAPLVRLAPGSLLEPSWREAEL